MNKQQLIEKHDKLQAELDQLKREIDKPEIDIFKQRGVEVWVWDDSVDRLNRRIIQYFNSEGKPCASEWGDISPLTWENYEVAFPQWINIPDELMEEPDIKGSFVIECKDGMKGFSINAEHAKWDLQKDDHNRIKRICILENQA